MKATLSSVSVLLAAVLGCGSAQATADTSTSRAAASASAAGRPDSQAGAVRHGAVADTPEDAPTRHEGVLAAGDTVRIPLPVGPRHLQGSLTLADEQAPAQGYRLWLEAPGWHRELAGQEASSLMW